MLDRLVATAGLAPELLMCLPSDGATQSGQFVDLRRTHHAAGEHVHDPPTARHLRGTSRG